MGFRFGCAICVWVVLLAPPAVAAEPLPLPPGVVELEEACQVGDVTALAYTESGGNRSPHYLIERTPDGYGLFELRCGSKVWKDLVYSSPDLDPGILAVGREIVVGIKREGGTRLFFLSGPRPVTVGGASEHSPSFSPDWRWLVFIAERGGKGKLYGLWYGEEGWNRSFQDLPYLEAGERGEGVIPLFPGPGEERSPAFGPYGLAFLSNLMGTWDLWLLGGEDLSRPRRVLAGVDPDSPVAWVGRRIFVVRDGQPGLVSLDGGFFRPLSGPAGWWRAPGAPFFPVIRGRLHEARFPGPLSPDFAVIREADPEGYGELWLCTLDGSGWKVADDVRGDGVAWSPDGARIAYLRRLPGSGDLPHAKEAGYCPYCYELWVARADGTEARLVMSFPHTGSLWCLWEVGWSRDGGRIYFGVSGSPTHREIWSVYPDGTGLTYHTWGWYLAFHRNGRISGITRGGIPFVYDPETEAKLFFEEWGVIHRAAFSPDGERFLAEVNGALALIDWRAGTERPLLPLEQASPRWWERGSWSLEISWHPSGTGFAFASAWDGDDEIWYYDLTTDEVLKLTDNHWRDERPLFSPDGAYLAYAAYGGGTPRIRLLRWTDRTEIVTSWEPPDWGPVVIWRPREGR